MRSTLKFLLQNFKHLLIARLSCINILFNGCSLRQDMTNSGPPFSFLPFKEGNIAISCGVDADPDPAMSIRNKIKRKCVVERGLTTLSWLYTDLNIIYHLRKLCLSVCELSLALDLPHKHHTHGKCARVCCHPGVHRKLVGNRVGAGLGRVTISSLLLSMFPVKIASILGPHGHVPRWH